MAQAGSIKEISDSVSARTSQGQVRELNVGDLVYENELIETSDGSRVTIELDNGKTIDLSENAQIFIDESVIGVVDVRDAVVSEVESLQAALEAGEEIGDEEATAVGEEDDGFDYSLPYYAGDQTRGEVGSYLFPTEYGSAEEVIPEETGEIEEIVPLNDATVSLTATASVEGSTITYTATVDNEPLSNITVTLSNGEVVTILAGATSGAVTIPAQADDVYVDPSTESTTIENATGGGFDSLAIDTTPAVVLVVDTIDNTTATLSIVDVNEDAATFTVVATLDHAVRPGDDPLVITTEHGDITISSGVNGGLSGSIDVPINLDDFYNDSTPISASISNIIGGNFENVVGVDAQALVYDDPELADTTTVTLDDVTVTEAETITYTASVDNAPQGSDLVLTLNNGAVITIAAGATTGSSIAYAAQGDDVYLDSDSDPLSISTAVGGNYEDLDSSDTATLTISDTIDTTTVTLTASSDSVMEGEMITYTAEVDHVPQGNLVITLNDTAHTQITILSGELSGSSSPVAAPDAPDGGTTLTVGIDTKAGGNYEYLDISDTAVVIIGDYTPEGGTTYATVDDDGLAGGIPGGIDDYTDTNADGDNNEATFSGTLQHTIGSDGYGTVTFADMDTLTGMVGTETVTYIWIGDTLTATVTGGDRDGTNLFTVQVTADTGAYKVTLLNNVLHESLDGSTGDNMENDAAAALTYTVMDADGSEATGTLNVTFDDDMPIATGALDSTTFNHGDDAFIVTENLNVEFGADGFGNYAFTGFTDGDSGEVTANGSTSTMTVGGIPVLLSGAGTNILTGTADGDTVFTVTLNDAGTYTLDMVKTLDSPATFNVDDLGGLGISGGNSTYYVVGSGTDTYSDDILITAVQPGGTVNTANDDIGTGSQWINPMTGLKFEFVEDIQSDSSYLGPPRTLTGVQLGVADVKGGDTQTNVLISLYDGTDNNIIGTPSEFNSVVTAISYMSGGILVTFDSPSEIAQAISNGNIEFITDYEVTNGKDGSVLVSGIVVNSVDQNTDVGITTNTGFDSAEFVNHDGSDFSVNGISGAFITNEPVSFDAMFTATDGDGDTVEDTFTMNLNPVIDGSD